MLRAITLLLICQLAGEVIVRSVGAPVPGPVLGMVLMLVILGFVPPIAPLVEHTASTLLSHLSLLFIPAGVGIIRHWQQLGDQWLAISIALLVSAIVTLLVTAAVFQLLINRRLQRG